MRFIPFTLAMLVGLSCGGSTPLVTAQTPPAGSAPGPESKPSTDASAPKTVPAKVESIQVVVSLNGVLVPTHYHEIMIEPQKATQFEVEEVVAHGQQVAAGDVLIRFNSSKLDQAIAEQETALALLELGLQENQHELALAQERLPLDTERLEITRRRADEDYRRYQEVDHPFARKAADVYLKGAENNLEYNAEELKQLEQMYKADDLTEETEEIVLKRARNDFERAGFYFEQSKKEFAETTNVTLPREAHERMTGHRLSELEYKRAALGLPLEMRRRETNLAKLKLEFEKASRELAEYRADRERLVIKAPAPGTIYYGRMRDGKWPAAADATQRLRPHGNVDPYDVFMTIVDNSSLAVTAQVGEAALAQIRQGMAGRLIPTSRPETRIPVKISRISDIPMSDGQYSGVLDLTGGAPRDLVAGMTGTVKLVTYRNAQAVVVPAKAVFADEDDDTRHFVYVLGPDQKPSRRECVKGVTVDERTEIVSGVAAGEAILENKP